MYFNLLYIQRLIINAHVGEWSPHVPLKKFKKAVHKNALKHENRDPRFSHNPTQNNLPPKPQGPFTWTLNYCVCIA
jgi:hypothetical protein